MDEVKERFFYHSFSRRSQSQVGSHDKELAVLESIAKHGLLLTPERLFLKERLRNGNFSEPAIILQKRICFTELAPSELPSHCSNFGKFSFEWSVQKLRELGAVPVFYVPINGKLGSAETAAASILSRLGEIQTVIERLCEIKSVSVGIADHMPIVLSDKATGRQRILFDVKDANNLIECLEKGNQPMDALLNSLRAVFGYFYPTENLEYGSLLSYYRQREWRIVGNMVLDGVELTKSIADNEAAEISNLDRDYFERLLEYPSGRERTIKQTLKYPSFEGFHILESCRRIIVPESAVNDVKSILNSHQISLEVASLSTC